MATHCRRCSRPLKNPLAIAKGIGPTCEARLAAVAGLGTGGQAPAPPATPPPAEPCSSFRCARADDGHEAKDCPGEDGKPCSCHGPPQEAAPAASNEPDWSRKGIYL